MHRCRPLCSHVWIACSRRSHFSLGFLSSCNFMQLQMF
ncbi:hypothetical protein Patl1_21886 [Pistacia atlantica]|uniref:Uncharacterized protein n=1 Tax=Pistacia atlantica TaxID=434234 RepID=A0ACC1BHT1_9ROSI|nr:hypothetical protein Patl1_21886 [Pistacia atlantica]